MLTRTFAFHKFRSLLLSCTLGMLVEYLVQLSGSLIAGNLLGETALSAVTLASPFVSFSVFVAFLFAIGTPIVLSYEVGRGNRDVADGYFTLGLIFTLVSGTVLTTIFTGFYGNIDRLYEISPEVKQSFLAFFGCLCLVIVPMMLDIYLYAVVLCEGGEKFCVTSSIVQFFTTVCSSLLLCHAVGIGGIALGILLGNLASLAVLTTCLFSKHSSLRLRWLFSAGGLLRILKYGIVDGNVYLFLSLTTMLLNVYLLKNFGDEAIVVFSIVSGIMVLMISLFDNCGEAIMPLVNVYRGENSGKGIVKTMKIADRAALIQAVGLMVLLLVFAESIPRLFGVTTPEVVRQAAWAVRIFALSSIPCAFILLYASYYVYVDKIFLSMFLVFLHLLAFPVLFGTVFGHLFGLHGVWIGLTVAALAALLVGALSVKFRHGNESFPLLLDDHRTAAELSYDVPKTREGIRELVCTVEEDLTRLGVDRKKIFQIMLIIEETEISSLGNDGKNGKAIIECTILQDDPTILILRDTGNIVDPTEDTGLPDDYLSLKIRTSYGRLSYSVVLGKNRVIYKF